MSIKLATHLYRNRHGVFYFRLVFPKDLRGHVQQREFRFSLYTEQRQEAIIAAIPLIADLPHLTADLRRMADDSKSPTPDYFRRRRDELLKNSVLKAKVRLLESDLADQKERMAGMVPRTKAKQVGKIMHKKGQLRGKRELEERLVFRWPAGKTALFSEYLRDVSRHIQKSPFANANFLKNSFFRGCKPAELFDPIATGDAVQ